MKIRIGILGYGNLGRGTEKAVAKNKDMELAAVFTRRDPKSVAIATPNVPVYGTDELESMTDNIDVLIICGGSATDLPEMTPTWAEKFNCIDSFDTHKNIPAHYAKVDAAAKKAGKVSIISCGWDPGMFSISRVYAYSILPDGQDYTFWGRGVSQGHSDAVRRIEGVLDARQYTVPVPEAIEAVRTGTCPELSVRQKHTRECYIVAAEGADKAKIEEAVKTMPNYFDEYDTTVTFISAEEMAKNHAALPHGGSVIYTGESSDGTNHVVEFRLTLDSNPEFTGSVLCAAARAAYRMNSEGQSGCRTMLDVPPAYLSALDPEELRAHYL